MASQIHGLALAELGSYTTELSKNASDPEGRPPRRAASPPCPEGNKILSAGRNVSSSRSWFSLRHCQ